MINPKDWKKRTKAILLCLIVLVSLNIFWFEQFIIKSDYSNDFNESSNNDFAEGLIGGISNSNNTYSGIGSPWNITHYANRTDKGIQISMENNDFDNSAKVPLGKNWYGQNLTANIRKLYDYQNWNNGTFNFGSDDANQPGDDDTQFTSGNIYQNWTFHKFDSGSYTNLMSGNYLENYDGHNCLELRMDGELDSEEPDAYGYNEGDKAYWSTYFSVPRGNIVFGNLEFEVKINQTININGWELKAYLNNQEVYSIPNYILEQFLSNSWGKISVPMTVWTNKSNIFQNPAHNEDILLNMSLEYTSGTTWYKGFDSRKFQQMFIDNVNVSLKAEAKPSDVYLEMNNTKVNDIDYGKGFVKIEDGNWDGDVYPWVRANFSSFGTGKFGDYSVEFETDLNLFALKHTPDTNYELDTSSLGVKFSALNDSSVEWKSYGFINVPTGYEETMMLIQFPEDLRISWISEAAQPSINLTSSCDTSNLGKIIIPVSQLTDSPEGFWTFEGISPNYGESLNFYNNATGVWRLNSTFLSGDYVNISTEITKNSLIENYIGNTQARLQIKFPNGSIWSEKTQFKTLQDDGIVYFEPFQVPESGPNYLVGEYEALITWNNSYSSFGLNETGIIVKRFLVKHNSILIPDENYFESQLEGSTINLKVSFSDLNNDKAIQNAIVYTYNFTHPSTPMIFSEVSPGYYLLEYNFIGAEAGNNSIMIYANSSHYQNAETLIKIEVIKETEITVENEFLSGIPYKSNFSIDFNYTEKYFGEGIITDDLSSDWDGDHSFYDLGEGNYRLVCNASGPSYEPNNLYSLIVTVKAESYVSKSIPVRIFISDLGASLRVEVNGTTIGEDDMVDFEFKDQMNISVYYTGDLQNHISGANVRIVGASQSLKLTENVAAKRYERVFNVSDFGLGIHYFTVFANSSDYNPKSFRFIIEVTEWQTKLSIILNGEDKTEDPLIDVPIGRSLNLTVRYTTVNNIHISNASVKLSGDLQLNLTEDKDFEQYFTLIETNNFDIGVKIFTVTAEKDSYITQTSDVRLNVRKRKAEITTEEDEEQFSVAPGADFVIRFSLEDLDFNSSISNASLRYSWEFGQGILTDPDNDGIYVLKLNNVPEGSYTIRISAFAGENYEFESYQLTLTATLDPEVFLLVQTLIIIAIVASAAIGGYIYAYQKVLKYPKSVRKVRKFKKTLSKDKKPDISIKERKNAFNEAYQKELEESTKGTSKLSKIKPKLSGKINKEKVVDETVEKATKKGTESNE